MTQILNSEIHEGLENKEVRDFLAITLSKLVKKSNEINKLLSEKVGFNDAQVLSDWAIENYKLQLKHNADMLEMWQHRKAIETIMSLQNWHQFDVYNESKIIQDPLKEFWMAFIGTKDEYKAFLEKHNLM